MPTNEILTLEIEPPYIGSAVSPTVDIDETTDDITVTITDFRGEHSYTVEKTDQAIEDAEQAAQNANDTAQNVAQGWANRQNEINVTMDSMRTLMTNSANAESQRVIAENARVTAENAREQEWEGLSTNVAAATSAANEAAGQANTAAQGAIGAANAANDATTLANNTITGITQTANQIFAQAGQATIDANAAAQSANTAATNATTKAGLADTAAQNADTATTAANNAAQTATTAAEQADAAREAIQDDLAAKVDKDGYYPQLTAGLADTLMSGDTELVQFAQRTSDHNGVVDIQSLRGNTVVWNQIVEDIDDSVSIPNTHVYVARINGVTTRGVSDNTALAVVGGRDNVYDLTRMFGAGSEPATVAEFERMFSEPYYPYDAGSLLSVNIEGVKSVGFNQLNLDEANIIQGNFENPGRAQNVHTEGYIEVLPNMQYEQCHDALSKMHGQYVRFYDENKVQIGATLDVYTNASFTFTTPHGTRYVRFMWYSIQGITPSDVIALNLCLHLVLTGYRNGEYEEYWQQIREIPASTYFPDGLRSAGTAYDELDFVNHKAVRRIGAVDLGALDWSAVQSEQSEKYRMKAYVTGIRHAASSASIANIKCVPYESISENAIYAASANGISVASNEDAVYIYDESHNTSDGAAAFKASLDGVMLYYELATPTKTDLPETLQATYPVETGGTESIVIPTDEQSAPPTLAIVYGYTAEGVRDVSQSIVAPVEHGTASSNYGVGSYLVMGGILYHVTTAIATGETINPGTNCTATTVMAEIIRLTA